MERQPFNIATEHEFQELMEEIDRELRSERVPIPARQLQAIAKIGSRFGLCLRLVPSDQPPVEGCYTDDSLSIRILNWIADRYGERLIFEFPTGSMAFSIRGDLYKVRFPKAWGPMGFSSMPHAFGQRQVIVRNGVPYPNLWDFVEGMTAALANSLTAEEQEEIGVQVTFGYEAQQAIREREHLPLIREAMGNLDSAVSHLFGSPRQYGQSKWESLQATEKLLKAYVSQEGENFQQTHDLRALADHAARLGLPRMSDDVLRRIQCPPGVRYGQPTVTEQEAVDAHHASLEAGVWVAVELHAP